MVWSGTRPESASACTGARRSNACVLPAKPPPACVTFVARPCYHLWYTGLSTTGPHLRQCMCTRLVCTPGRVPCSPFPPISGGHHVCGPSGIRRVCRVLAERSVHPPSMYKHLARGGFAQKRCVFPCYTCACACARVCVCVCCTADAHVCGRARVRQCHLFRSCSDF